MKRYLLIAITIMILAQIYIPVSMMSSRFDILKNGTEYKFKVQPIDPYDAFRGRYIAIYVDGGQTEYKQSKKTVYAVLNTDENGFSYVGNIIESKPDGNNYIKAKSRYGRLQLPFERYYMEEKLAPKAEAAYRNETKDAYIKVRVKNGNAVIEGLYIDNMRIEDFVKQNKVD